MSQIEDRSPLCLDPQFHFQVSAKVPFHVRKQLERYQIFTSQFDDTGMLHPSFKVIGFYHALKMYGVISDFELFQIYLQIRTFCLSPEDIDIICRKFHIHIVLFLIDENGSHLVNVNGKNYCGVPRDETFYYIKMNIFKHHIFLEEITAFSTYYIKNIENEPEEHYGKEFNPAMNYYENGRYFLTSGQLVKVLYDKGYFTPSPLE